MCHPVSSTTNFRGNFSRVETTHSVFGNRCRMVPTAGQSLFFRERPHVDVGFVSKQGTLFGDNRSCQLGRDSCCRSCGANLARGDIQVWVFDPRFFFASVTLKHKISTPEYRSDQRPSFRRNASVAMVGHGWVRSGRIVDKAKTLKGQG